MRRFVIQFTLLLSSAAFAQTPQVPLQLSPQSAYEQATRPLEITRRSIQNWSDSETAALSVAIQQAKDACSARTANQFSGEDLIAYARLCSLGLQWPTVQEAATLYLDATHRTGPEAKPADAFPGLTQAYGYMIDSSLHLNDPAAALVASFEMLKTVPYTDLTSQSTNETIRYLQLIQTPDALSLLAKRQAVLLPLLRSAAIANPTSSQHQLSLHDLYADGIELASLQQFANQPDAAAATIAELEAALPPNLSTDESILIAESRRQYALLGTPLPNIASSAYLLREPVNHPPHIETYFSAATALLLFPDWCAQCIRMGPQLMGALSRITQFDGHFFALLAQATPFPTPTPIPARTKPASAKAARFLPSSAAPDAALDQAQSLPKTPAELLRGTPTLVVSNDILTRFAANDFPVLIVTDHNGIIRFLQTAPENVLVSGGLADQVVARVIEQWPAPPAK
ncbi:hypothetical protein EDE15_0986 [Edaphobacter aggregans]|uniref:Thioredoxin domain-containing protein n=1 Tax=Edaphobacter aggregans TaxID=570835 RepID=A0A3R9R1A8_9BACT|nr:hypothetical protein [Edaphobacter aggregans]RSL15497.1 hypothetical protein EDE15_0986 [Edaphobacter aggregans]